MLNTIPSQIYALNTAELPLFQFSRVRHLSEGSSNSGNSRTRTMSLQNNTGWDDVTWLSSDVIIRDFWGGVGRQGDDTVLGLVVKFIYKKLNVWCLRFKEVIITRVIYEFNNLLLKKNKLYVKRFRVLWDVMRICHMNDSVLSESIARVSKCLSCRNFW